MKYCRKCDCTFDDSASFCPSCGSPLEAAQEEAPRYAQGSSAGVSNSGASNRSGFFATLKEAFMSYTAKWDESDNPVVRFLPSIISILGLIVAWNWSYWIGGAAAIGGIGYGVYSKNTLNKTIAVAAGAITLVLIVMFCL